ncbi:hypothetical protein DCF83_14880 [Edwardsiella tarda]|uniref:hypothetical protein n=1 Tax=Edwardsiella tarda TaxID=636 RepID=UPI0011B2555C|nr:hypothetical protein [Edwardsiella tarda]UCQ26599.1 hypothetical protein DCF83_11045 [Edwardsiella tarda]UCQ27276.1 hypothetical protein DCF83_14880 [Edwardsiella tarda]
MKPVIIALLVVASFYPFLLQKAWATDGMLTFVGSVVNPPCDTLNSETGVQLNCINPSNAHHYKEQYAWASLKNRKVSYSAFKNITSKPVEKNKSLSIVTISYN